MAVAVVGTVICRSMILCGWFKYLMEDGMNELEARWCLQLAFCISFQGGEGRNGRVRSGWGQIRLSL